MTDKDKPFTYRHDEPIKLKFILRYVTPTTGTRPQNLRDSALNHAYQGTSLFKYIYIFVLFFCLPLHRLAVRISLPFHIFLRV